MIESLKDYFRKFDYIYIIGNGGSAATADHLANDLVKKCGLRAVSLCSNTSILTAYANDCGYDKVFVEQLKVFLRKNDLLVTISTSKKSRNILNAIEYAKDRDIAVFEFPTFQLSTEDIENEHLRLVHTLCRTVK